MNYFATDKPFPRGEIMIRGATVFKGYYKDEKNTLDTIDNEGWLKSGDIGFIDNRGCLTIIDRKKNIFKVLSPPSIALFVFSFLSLSLFSLCSFLILFNNQHYCLLTI